MNRSAILLGISVLGVACGGDTLSVGQGYACLKDDGTPACGAACATAEEGVTCSVPSSPVTHAVCRGGAWQCEAASESVSCLNASGTLNCDMPCGAMGEPSCSVTNPDESTDSAVCTGGVWVCSHQAPVLPVACQSDSGLNCDLPCDPNAEETSCQVDNDDGSFEVAVCSSSTWECLHVSGPVSCYAESGFSCGLPCDAPEHATGCLERYRNNTAEFARCSDGKWECTRVDMAAEPVGCFNDGELNCGMPCEPPEDLQTCWAYLENGAVVAEECTTGGCSLLSLDGFATLAECVDGLWECTPYWAPYGRACGISDEGCVEPRCDTAGDRDFRRECEQLVSCFENDCHLGGMSTEADLSCDSEICNDLVANSELGGPVPEDVDLDHAFSGNATAPFDGEIGRLASAAYKVFRSQYSIWVFPGK